jgi:hypothetical protein
MGVKVDNNERVWIYVADLVDPNNPALYDASGDNTTEAAKLMAAIADNACQVYLVGIIAAGVATSLQATAQSGGTARLAAYLPTTADGSYVPCHVLWPSSTFTISATAGAAQSVQLCFECRYKT